MPLSREQKRDLLDRVVREKNQLRGRGGDGTLRFSVVSQRGWVTAGRRESAEVLCDLWNFAEELLRETDDE